MDPFLHEILAARERRVQRQQALLAQFSVPLVCFTLNIPGPIKDSPLIRRAFDEGLRLLDDRLTNVLYQEATSAPTGSVAFYAVDMPVSELKELCAAIEDSCPLGRLFDMDVLDTDGKKLDRAIQRGCMVCGAPGRLCAATRAHSVELLQQTTWRIITEHFSDADAAYIADTAVQALLEEVHTTPKPGLVDEHNTGSHSDMDIPLFTASAKALRPYFLQCARLGQQTAAQPPQVTFPLLRAAGVNAEKQMYAATGGVNTHKGAIYTLGILCGAAGRLWTAEKPFAREKHILKEAAQMVRPFVKADFAAIDTPKTAGERLYLEQGLTGIRGEAAAGFPSVEDISLPVYRRLLDQGRSANDAGAIALLHLIARVEDTNLYRRGGPEGAAFAKSAAGALLPEPTMAQLFLLDSHFIRRNLSPGGCADLLAATIFLHRLTM